MERMYASAITCSFVLAILVSGALSQSNATCGSSPSNPHGRVVGGEASFEKSWPWMGSLKRSSGSHTCGATLISDEWAITAAHCVGHFTSVIFGDLLLDTPSQGGQSRTFTIYVHPDYNDGPNANDVALLRLNEPVLFTDYVSPACLSTTSAEVTSYTNCWVTGWGYTVEGGGALPNVMQEAPVNLFSSTDCTGFYGSSVDNDVMICAGKREGGIDTCQGDSGGPLVCENAAGAWDLVGVTSFGQGCARPNYPGVYARVSRYTEFIERMMSIEYAPCPSSNDFYIAGEDECDHVANCIGGHDEEDCPGFTEVIELQSPLYPADYPNSQRIVWVFKVDDPSANITVHFSAFDLESNYDILSIGTGWAYTNRSSVISAYTGSEIPEDIVTSENRIWIQFTSDASVTKQGFSAMISSVGGDDGSMVECSDDKPCTGENEECGITEVNNSTVPKCVCVQGFIEEDGVCVDVNECLHPEMSNCSTVAEICINDYGTFWCDCKPEYVTEAGCDTGNSGEDPDACGQNAFGLIGRDEFSSVVEVPIQGWPWMASLRYTGHTCSATLIDERWAITAAACIGYFSKIVFGDSLINEESIGHQERSVTVFVYPGYTGETDEDDFALLKLSEPVDIGSYVRPVCLSTSSTGGGSFSRCFVTGWNLMDDYEVPPSPHLKELEVAILDDSECSAIFGSFYNAEIMVCAALMNSTITSCQTDYGDPLVCLGMNNRWHLVGTKSWGVDCSYGLYTRTSHYTSFIDQIVNGDFMRCPDGSILLPDQICNFVADCDDGVDEIDCPGLEFGEEYTMTSPNYPGEYPNSADVTYVIPAVPDYYLLVHFMTFHLEHGYDVLYYSERNFSSGVEPTRLTGSDIPDAITVRNKAWFRFTSDHSITKAGFEAKVTVIHQDDFFECDNGQVLLNTSRCDIWVDCPTAEDEMDCGLLGEGDYFVIASINYPDDYPDSYTTTHLFIAEDDLHVFVAFHFFDLEGGFDFLRIGHGTDPSDESSLLHTLTGPNLPEPIMSPESTLWVTFTSDSSVSKSGYIYNATIASRAREPCSEFLIVTNEEQSTERYQPTPNDEKCGISFMAENVNMAVQVTIVAAEVNCNVGEFIIIQRSLTGRKQRRRTKCGIITSKRFSSGDSVMLIDYIIKMDGHGFRVNYVLVQDFFPNFRGCNRLISLRHGGPMSFSSPGYPGDYRSKKRCEYRLLARPGSSILVVFEDFEMEDSTDCNADFVKLTDFVTSEASPRYCGGHSELSYNSTSHYLSVWFRANFRNQFRGFHAVAWVLD